MKLLLLISALTLVCIYLCIHVNTLLMFKSHRKNPFVSTSSRLDNRLHVPIEVVTGTNTYNPIKHEFEFISDNSQVTCKKFRKKVSHDCNCDKPECILFEISDSGCSVYDGECPFPHADNKVSRRRIKRIQNSSNARILYWPCEKCIPNVPFIISQPLSKPSRSIDVVISWVNYTDARWREKFGKSIGKGTLDIGGQRYCDFVRDLQTTTFSIQNFYGRKPYVIFNSMHNDCPALENITCVSHETIFGNYPSPSNNRISIKLRSGFVPDISEWFLNIDDDIFLINQLDPSFWASQGRPTVHFPYPQDSNPKCGGTKFSSTICSTSKFFKSYFNKGLVSVVDHVPILSSRTILRDLPHIFPEFYNFSMTQSVNKRNWHANTFMLNLLVRLGASVYDSTKTISEVHTNFDCFPVTTGLVYTGDMLVKGNIMHVSNKRSVESKISSLLKSSSPWANLQGPGWSDEYGYCAEVREIIQSKLFTKFPNVKFCKVDKFVDVGGKCGYTYPTSSGDKSVCVQGSSCINENIHTFIFATPSDLKANYSYFSLVDEIIYVDDDLVFTSYPQIESVIKKHNIHAVCPGWGYLSESADFAEFITNLGVSWIGPRPNLLRIFGNKDEATQLASSLQIPILSSLALSSDLIHRESHTPSLKYPQLLKYVHGGGGRGIRIVYSHVEFEQAAKDICSEVGIADLSQMLSMPYIESVKHIEAQLIGSRVVGLRECSIQRRHQKLIEESVSISDYLSLSEAAEKIAKATDYDNVGTVEFLVDTKSSHFYFLEVNYRLQVEHRVTELNWGDDLNLINISVEMALIRDGRINGDLHNYINSKLLSLLGNSTNLKEMAKLQEMRYPEKVIALRVCVEDPHENWSKSIGSFVKFISHPYTKSQVYFSMESMSTISMSGDSQIGHLFSVGVNREIAISKLIEMSNNINIHGTINTNIQYMTNYVLSNSIFHQQSHTTRFLNDIEIEDLNVSTAMTTPTSIIDGLLLIKPIKDLILTSLFYYIIYELPIGISSITDKLRRGHLPKNSKQFLSKKIHKIQISGISVISDLEVFSIYDNFYSVKFVYFNEEYKIPIIGIVRVSDEKFKIYNFESEIQFYEITSSEVVSVDKVYIFQLKNISMCSTTPPIHLIIHENDPYNFYSPITGRLTEWLIPIREDDTDIDEKISPVVSIESMKVLSKLGEIIIPKNAKFQKIIESGEIVVAGDLLGRIISDGDIDLKIEYNSKLNTNEILLPYDNMFHLFLNGWSDGIIYINDININDYHEEIFNLFNLKTQIDLSFDDWRKMINIHKVEDFILSMDTYDENFINFIDSMIDILNVEFIKKFTLKLVKMKIILESFNHNIYFIEDLKYFNFKIIGIIYSSVDYKFICINDFKENYEYNTTTSNNCTISSNATTNSYNNDIITTTCEKTNNYTTSAIQSILNTLNIDNTTIYLIPTTSNEEYLNIYKNGSYHQILQITRKNIYSDESRSTTPDEELHDDYSMENAKLAKLRDSFYIGDIPIKYFKDYQMFQILKGNGDKIDLNLPKLPEDYIYSSILFNQQNIGVYAWLLNYSEISHMDYWSLVIANDICHENGSFSIIEDDFISVLIDWATEREMPILFIHGNSGARFNIRKDLLKNMYFKNGNFYSCLDCIEDIDDFIENVSFTKDLNGPYYGEFLEDSRDNLLYKNHHCGERGINHNIIKINCILSPNAHIGVENLSGSGRIVSSMRRAYLSTITISIVLSRTVGVGAYLARLSRRVIQKKEKAPILLTGYSALNALLGEKFYSSNEEIGGVNVMSTNGVTQATCQTDIEGCEIAIKWLKIAKIKNDNFPDPIDRNVSISNNFISSPISLATGEYHVHGEWHGSIFDKDSFFPLMTDWCPQLITGRARIGGIGVGVIIVETNSVPTITSIPDPANLENSEIKKRWSTGQVWYPDSAYKTASVISDCRTEKIDLIIFANWRGFSGGASSMFESVLKFGSMIVEEIVRYGDDKNSPNIFIYIPPGGELRGGAWVVLDANICQNHVYIYSDGNARGNVLEPNGVARVKFKSDLKKFIDFADLHDHPERMLKVGAIHGIVDFKDARRFFSQRVSESYFERNNS